jgi:hypothetical protein
VQVPASLPPSQSLVQALQAQSDLRQLPTEGGVIAFDNVAWPPATSSGSSTVVDLSPGGGTSGQLRELALAFGLFCLALAIGEGFLRRRRHRRPRPIGTFSDDDSFEDTGPQGLQPESVPEPEPASPPASEPASSTS